MRIATLLALLVCTHAYADEPYPELAGEKYPVEHWRLHLIERPCDVHCQETAKRTVPGFEHYSRTSCIRDGVERLSKALQPDPFGGSSPIVGFQCLFVREDD